MKTHTLLRVFTVAAGLSLTIAGLEAHARSTPRYYKCPNRISGDWSLGRSGDACDASAFGKDQTIWNSYKPLVLDERVNLSSERPRYAQEVNALLRTTATKYLKRRKPGVSATEASWFALAVQVVANQESGWSHYRLAQGRLKMMRGDSGHGHGLMQIDDRGHFPVIQNGTAWNIMGNLTYGLDLYYRLWEAAPSKYCVRSPSNYEARMRAAWSAYNSGSNFCRWQTRSRDHAKDEQFYAKYRARNWTPFVRDPNRSSSINIDCLMDHPQGCGSRGFAFTDGVTSPIDTHGLAPEAGDVVRVVAPNGMRLRGENGEDLETIHTGRTLRIEAVDIRGPTQQVYYQVTEQGHTGFVYGGQLLPKPTLSSWTKPVK